MTQLHQAVSLQLRHVLTIGKNLKQQYLLHMSHNMANFGILMDEIGLGVCGTPANLNGFHVLPSLLLPLMEFCVVQTSLYVQVMRSPLLAVLLHGTPAVGVSQTLRCGTRNGVSE